MASLATRFEYTPGKIWCLVTQPDSCCFSLKLIESAKGQDLLDEVCNRLGIVEADYFGLQFANSRGEIFWLNLRNRISRQVGKPEPYSFYFCVKFYVQPCQLLQSSTRRQFFLNCCRELRSGKLKPVREQSVRVEALIAQAKDGDFRENHIAYNPSVTQDWPTDFRSEVITAHSQLEGMPRDTAECSLLKEVSTLPDYGTEFHSCRNEENKLLTIGVGIEALKITKLQDNSTESIPYSCLHMATHNGKFVKLDIYINERRDTDSVFYRLNSKESACALYRAITEHHAFFRCDSVTSAVKDQVANDFFDTIRNIFNDDNTAEQNYIFDTKRTCKEAHDHARRILFNFGASIFKTMSNDLKQNTGSNSTDNMDSKNADELQEKLDVLMESCFCQTCGERQINTDFQCGHMFCCSDCVPQLSKCPLCRVEITSIIPVFLPVDLSLSQ